MASRRQTSTQCLLALQLSRKVPYRRQMSLLLGGQAGQSRKSLRLALAQSAWELDSEAPAARFSTTRMPRQAPKKAETSWTPSTARPCNGRAQSCAQATYRQATASLGELDGRISLLDYQLGILTAAPTWFIRKGKLSAPVKQRRVERHVKISWPTAGTLLTYHWQQVVSRRALLRWLYDELSVAATPDGAGSAYFERAACGRFRALGAWQLHMFVSQPPCGDACIATAPEPADAQTRSLDSVGGSGAACAAGAPELIGGQAPSRDELACGDGARAATAPQLSCSTSPCVAAMPELAGAETWSCHGLGCSSGACIAPELPGAHALSHDLFGHSDLGVEALGADQQPADVVKDSCVAGEAGSGVAPARSASSLVPVLSAKVDGTLPAVSGSVLGLGTAVEAALLAVRSGECGAERKPLGSCPGPDPNPVEQGGHRTGAKVLRPGCALPTAAVVEADDLPQAPGAVRRKPGRGALHCRMRSHKHCKTGLPN